MGNAVFHHLKQKHCMQGERLAANLNLHNMQISNLLTTIYN